MSLRPALAALIFGVSGTSVSYAHAGDVDIGACAEAAVEGQRLQHDGKLVAARGRFSACARQSCRSDIVKDCTGWLRDIDEAIPTIVVGARDEAGLDLVDVRISLDGEPLAEDAKSRATPVDPGPHAVLFERNGAPAQSKHVVLREGEHRRVIVAIFASERPRDTVVTDRGSKPMPPAAYVAGGVALVGLGVFGTFGAVGVADRQRAGCAEGCATDDAARVRREFIVADIGLGVGLVALAATTIFVLIR